MRHMEAGRKLGVNVPHRKAMLRSLTLAILEHEEIQTTRARAKELRWYAEHVVTLAKRGDLSSRRKIVSLLGSTETNHINENRARKAIERLYSELVPRFKTRPGGYTQIFRLGKRRAGDNADMCYMRYIPAPDSKPDRKKGAKPKKDEAVTKTAKPVEDKAASAKKSTKAPEAEAAPKKAKKKEPQDQ